MASGNLDRLEALDGWHHSAAVAKIAGAAVAFADGQCSELYLRQRVGRIIAEEEAAQTDPDPSLHKPDPDYPEA